VVRVKFCGMRNRGELEAACRAGANAVGFLVGQRHVSTDFVSTTVANALAIAVPPLVSRVLVTHISDVATVTNLCSAVSCDTLQLHSDVSADEIDELRKLLDSPRIIAKISIDGAEAISRALLLSNVADALVVDSIDRAADRVGGTGKVHDWSISARIVERCSCPVILAGGLTPTNVVEAIRTVGPWGVDVNTGVKGPDGSRSEELMRQFVDAIRGYEAAV
jgi:phosphoribosylanthranilate isomerase